jgi:hypothetical protein
VAKDEKMPRNSDGDIIKGLGFVALYAAYLEEQIDALLFMLQPLEPFPEAEQRWPISKKINKASRLVAPLVFDDKAGLMADLCGVRDLFESRNEVIHGRIYANFDRPDTLKSGGPNVPDRRVDATELYALANDLFAARYALHKPMIFQLPQALNAKN